MAYILNTFVPENKKCFVALNEIYGLGKNLSVQICDQLGFSSELKGKHLKTSQIDQLTRCISRNYLTGVDLKEKVGKDKERFITINSYKGFRYIEKLPCRGQRTHGNAQTVRKHGTKETLLSLAKVTKNFGKRQKKGYRPQIQEKPRKNKK